MAMVDVSEVRGDQSFEVLYVVPISRVLGIGFSMTREVIGKASNDLRHVSPSLRGGDDYAGKSSANWSYLKDNRRKFAS